MKKVMFVISVLLLFILSHPIRADTVIDSVYSVPELDGNMCFNPDGQPEYLNTSSISLIIGDLGEPWIPGYPPNSCDRAFISFELPQIPENYQIDSVYVRLYQFNSFGNYNGVTGLDFPEWNIPGGDTIKCIMSHIDYGYQLDFGDWEKGDIGNPYTYTHNIGTITESGEDGYRYLDVNDCVLQDYDLGRILTQYRIAFEVNTDWDSLWDQVWFISGDSPEEYNKPKLFLYLSNNVSIQNNTIEDSNFQIHILPNPISNNSKILFSSMHSCYSKIKIFNIRGQLIRTIYKGYLDRGDNEIPFDSNGLSNGIYFLNVETDNQNLTQKIIILK